MQWFPDMLTVILEKGIWVGIALLALYFLVRWAMRSLAKELEAIHQAVIVIQDVRAAIDDPKDPQGKGIVRWHELRGMIESLHEEIENRCGNVNCPVIPLIRLELNAARSEITTNLEEAARTRLETREVIEKIFEAVREIFTDSKAFHSELGKVMIIAIQRMAEREKSHRKEDL